MFGLNLIVATGGGPLDAGSPVVESPPQLAITTDPSAMSAIPEALDARPEIRRPRTTSRNDPCALARLLQPSDMLILRSVTAAIVSRRTARRMARLIPNPLLRYAIVTIATALVPVVLDKFAERWRRGRITGTPRPKTNAVRF